jgi:hypothetical protein
MKAPQVTKYAICLRNKDAEDLVVRKLYPVLPDEKAEKENYLRIIDESGEDYLYPASYFFLVELPQKVERALRQTLPASVA